MLPPDFARMAAGCMAVVVVAMHTNLALCLVVVAINAAKSSARACPSAALGLVGCPYSRLGPEVVRGARGWGSGGVG